MKLSWQLLVINSGAGSRVTVAVRKSTFQRRDKTMLLSTRKHFITIVRFDETIVV